MDMITKPNKNNKTGTSRPGVAQVNSPCTTELAAIKQCRNGSRKAFEVIVNRYMKDAYFIALGYVGNRQDALDLSQEAFFKAYRKLDTLSEDNKFFPWFYQILKNQCFSHLRKFKNKKTQSLDGAEEPIVIEDEKHSFDSSKNSFKMQGMLSWDGVKPDLYTCSPRYLSLRLKS